MYPKPLQLYPGPYSSIVNLKMYVMLNEINIYDQIIVMDKGRIAQRGIPFNLLVKDLNDNKITCNGLFAQMVESTGENAKYIFETARDHY